MQYNAVRYGIQSRVRYGTVLIVVSYGSTVPATGRGIRRQIGTEAYRSSTVPATGLVRGHIGTRLVGSQGRTVRGLSVRKAGRCEVCRFRQ